MVKSDRVRIIPRLDIKGPNLVKGVHMEGLRIMGEPGEFVRYYYENGADEIIYIDTVASLYGRNHLTEIVKKAASETFIPLTVGGGIRTVEDIQTLLECGADKFAINTAAIQTLPLLEMPSSVLVLNALLFRFTRKGAALTIMNV